MDVVLGVAVTGPVARLALIGSGAQGADVIDQSVVDLDDNPIEKLTETVVGTNRLLAGENHRLVGTRLCWSGRSTSRPAAASAGRFRRLQRRGAVGVASGDRPDARGRPARRGAGDGRRDGDPVGAGFCNRRPGRTADRAGQRATRGRRRHRNLQHDDGETQRPAGRPGRCLPGGRISPTSPGSPISFAMRRPCGWRSPTTRPLRSPVARRWRGRTGGPGGRVGRGCDRDGPGGCAHRGRDGDGAGWAGRG